MDNITKIFNEKSSVINEWIRAFIAEHEKRKASIDSLNFSAISRYFTVDFLKASYVIYVQKITVIPLSEMGLEIFSEMESGKFVGMTYANYVFIKEDQMKNEALHFHELIHVLQWKYLGIEKFLFCYALGLIEHGYRNSPLEVMAFDHQARFEAGEVYEVEDVVLEEMRFFDEVLKKYNV